MAKIPATILTGFLGSGKTTLLAQLLRHPQMDKSAVIVNEFGEVGLDHDILAESEDIDSNTVLLSSGCICCSISQDLQITMLDLFAKREKKEIPTFNRLVIETTGLADPAPIIHTLMTVDLINSFYRLDGIITTVDTVNGMNTLDRQTESVKQAAVADRIVITKSDLGSEQELSKLRARLKEINPSSPLLTVVMGEAEPDKLLNTSLFDPKTKVPDVEGWLNEQAYAGSMPVRHNHHDHHSHHHDVNRHDDHIRAFCITRETAINAESFQSMLENLLELRGHDLLRVKGIINLEGRPGPAVIHGVQHFFHKPLFMKTWPSEDRRTRLVFITRDISQKVIENTLSI